MKLPGQHTLDELKTKYKELMEDHDDAMRLRGACDSKHGKLFIDRLKAHIERAREAYSGIDPKKEGATLALAILQARESFAEEELAMLQRADEVISLLENEIKKVKEQIKELESRA